MVYNNIVRSFSAISFWIGLVLIPVKSLQAQPQPSFIKNDLDRYIQKGMQDWQVPALAIVIVKDGNVVVRKGYGVQEIGKNEPVDENTLFFIASNSKLFTGTALAHLQYHKKINLNDKITKYFPDYRLYDDLTTQQVTIRDMLTHRIGTKTFQGDFTFWNTTLSSKEIMQRMRLLKPSGMYRQDYGYCNSCFLTAGEVIPVATQTSWFDYVADSITPLGYGKYAHQQQWHTAEGEQYGRSLYHFLYGKTKSHVPDDNWDNLGPAASIVSNVKDLTQWLQMQLDSGRLDGKQILPWQVLQATRDVQIITGSRKSTSLPMHFRGYGLGVNCGRLQRASKFTGTPAVQAGMVSNVCFVPEEKPGYRHPYHKR
jgi:CubicO group peptidase (beta-lactamase class C family)